METEKSGPANPATESFRLEALVDFPDDALMSLITITPAHVDAMMRRLKELGVRRVSWGYYGDGHGGMLRPSAYEAEYPGGWKNYDAAYRGLGNPLKVAVEAGHRHGLEVYAYFKPYETGPGMLFPEGSPQAKTMGLLPYIGGRLAWLDPFVVKHPELRIKRRTDDLPANVEQTVITTLRLIKKNDTPTRIARANLQLWTSAENWKYQPANMDFQFAETVEPAAREVRDQGGKILTRAGQPVRVLTLSGLKLSEPYVLVTTDFTEGKGDFVNAGTALVEARDEQDRVIPVEVASGACVWCSNLQNFRTAGLNFDYGWGDAPVALDAPNAKGRQGLIALARGRNRYLCGALCETEPKVQEFWLACIEEMMEAGADGVDFREENHSMMTDHPEDYGFNDVILKQCGDLKGEALLAKIARVRGDAYTEFLAACRQRLQARGRRMRYNLQVDWFRPDRPRSRALAYPAHLEWQWKRWLDEGLMDEAILRIYSIRYHGEPLASNLEDAVTSEMASHCARHNVPITFNRYLSATTADKLPAEIRQVREDGRFCGFILYETYNFLRFDAQGGCANILPELEMLREGKRER